MKSRSRSLIGAVALTALFVLTRATSLQGVNAKAGAAAPVQVQSAQSVQPSVAMENLSRMPLAFTENRGQWDERVLFRADGGGTVLWLTTEGAYYQFVRHIPRADAPGNPPFDLGSPDYRGVDIKHDHQSDSDETLILKADFVGANPNPGIVGKDEMEYKCNYFLGNDLAKWRTDVPNYKRVLYQDLYPGIDLAFYGKDGNVEYDFVVHPGADPGAIALALRVSNARALTVTGISC